MSSKVPGWIVDQVGPRSEDDPLLTSGRIFDLVPPEPGRAMLLPLLGRPGVTLGPSLARRSQVVAAISAIPGIGEVRLSPIGGTVGPGGPGWLSLLFAVRLPPGLPRPLDEVLDLVSSWLGDRLGGIDLQRGRVAGAWCPGFSDLGVTGRKLVGVGFKLRRDEALARAVICVRAPTDEELEALHRCHLTFGEGVAAPSLTCLADVLGRPGMTREAAMELLGIPAPPAGMILG
ncbi:MAG: hypothetical protein M0T72_00545 [Candidatus Dormibacteraeota bacterium]|nr:hypothetical protein [Candidatus Dormibacteraeota bacterium]